MDQDKTDPERTEHISRSHTDDLTSDASYAEDHVPLISDPPPELDNFAITGILGPGQSHVDVAMAQSLR